MDPPHPNRARSGCLAALLVVLLLVTAEDAAARPCSPALAATRTMATEVLREVRLDRIGARDLLSDVRSVRRLRHRSELFTPEPGVRRIERRLARLWTKRVPADVPLDALRIDHRIRASGLDGATAVQLSDVNFELPLRIRPTRPRVVCEGPGYRIVEGGAVVELVISRLPAAGRYNVEIETEVSVP